MNLQVEKTTLTNPTLMHLEAWLLAMDQHLKEENVFGSMDELATQFEYWRSEFCRKERDLECHWGDQVTVMLYGEDVILISDQRSGEYIKMSKLDEEEKETPLPSKKPKGILSSLVSAIAKIFLVMLLLQTTAYTAQAQTSGRGKTGKEVARSHQKQSVKSGKKLMKSFAKMTKPKKGGSK